ncbi:hypothetical protein EYF80_054863 [Liparis tanakae]|uniref:Uncharacterized protein n=1 Tax=Liparis tanakae TaxID=230148 RepID=A0A4Z2F1R2_9TELE|nr:hypothetical protein EYF80_054863 [Liparis tanakae]
MGANTNRCSVVLCSNQSDRPPSDSRTARDSCFRLSRGTSSDVREQRLVSSGVLSRLQREGEQARSDFWIIPVDEVNVDRVSAAQSCSGRSEEVKKKKKKKEEQQSARASLCVFSQAELLGVGDVGSKWRSASGGQQPQPAAPQSHHPIPAPEGLSPPLQGGQDG